MDVTLLEFKAHYVANESTHFYILYLSIAMSLLSAESQMESKGKVSCFPLTYWIKKLYCYSSFKIFHFLTWSCAVCKERASSVEAGKMEERQWLLICFVGENTGMWPCGQTREVVKISIRAMIIKPDLLESPSGS